jgi:predicted DNA-binding transcriptional regulator AlpA
MQKTWPDEVLTIRDLAAFTKLSRASIQRLLNGGNFPKGFYVGGSRRWLKTSILEWIETQMAANSGRRAR